MGLQLNFIKGAVDANVSWARQATNPFAGGVLAAISVSSVDVSSIPSPYARLDLFNDAFQEINNGSHDNVYRKCAAYCLDVFELLFRNGMDQLRDAGITIERFEYEGNHPPYSSNSIYYEALRAYRNNFGLGFFNAFYLVKMGSNVLASTSHLTGFYCPADVPEVQLNGNTYFLSAQNANNHWKLIEDRAADFQRFMYELLNILNLNASFVNLGQYINNKLVTKIAIWNTDGRNFHDLYPQFNITGDSDLDRLGLQLDTHAPKYLDTNGSSSVVYVICDRYDSCYLKYLLFPNISTAVSFRIDREMYGGDILNRNNPVTGNPYPWVSVNDFLSDQLVKLDSEIDSNRFLAIEGASNIIPPLTLKFFELFKKSDLAMEISQRVDGSFDVSIKLPVVGGSFIKLSRHYSTQPFGNDGEIVQASFDVAVYPFVKAPAGIDNFYRIMVVSQGGKKVDETGTSLFALNADGYIDDNSHISNPAGTHFMRTNTTIDSSVATFDGLDTYITYISLDSKYYEQDVANNKILHDSGNNEPLDFINLRLIDATDNPHSYEALLVPKMVQLPPAANSAVVAVDLGTTNTYISLGQGGKGKSYETHNGSLGDVEIGRLLISDPTETNKKIKYDKQTAQHQWCEFIPSYFSDVDGFHFSTPTVLNRRSTAVKEISDLKDLSGSPVASLVDVNIPFSLYENGIRTYRNQQIDNLVTGFKWFNFAMQHDKANAYYLFIDQLCFMLRANMLLNNFNPTITKLLWTYPLSFNDDHRKILAGEWENVYKKYFTDPTPPQGAPAQKRIIAVSESRTPLLHAQGIVNRIGVKLGIDIGGGTTDMIVYDGRPDGNGGGVRNSVVLSSSFRFAGNNLFAADGTVVNSNNYWYKLLSINNILANTFDNNQNITKTKVVIDDTGTNIADIMSYAFSSGNAFLTTALSSTGLIVTLHNAALLWQIAKMCKIADKNPQNIIFSGNGSLLLMMHQNINHESVLIDLINRVFNKVYGGYTAFDDSTVEILPEPKQATAKGAVDGSAELEAATVNTAINSSYQVNDDINSYKVLVGEQCYSNSINGNVTLPLKSNLTDEDKQGVVAQVNDFMEFYYNLVQNNTYYGGPYNVDILRQIVPAGSIDTYYNNAIQLIPGNHVNDSIFLGVISQIISEFVKNL
jgi:hypothetical protein